MNNEEETYKTLAMWFSAGFIAIIVIVLVTLFVYKFI